MFYILSYFLFQLFAHPIRKLPDFTAFTRLSDKFKMADAADDATAT